MKKSLAISIISVVAVLAIVLGILYYTNNQEKIAEIASLNANIAEKVSEINTLNSEVADRDSQIEALNAEVANKSSQIKMLNDDVAEKDWQIKALNDDALVKEYQIATLNTDILDKNARIERINADVSIKTYQIETLSNDLKDKAADIDALNEEVSEKEAQINALNEEIQILRDNGKYLDCYGLTVSGSADFYKKPSVKSDMIAKIENETLIWLISSVRSDDKTWYSAVQDDKMGYILSQYVDVIPDDEIETKRDSLYNLGKDYFGGKNDKPQDYEKAVHYYQLAASLGSASAYSALGSMYLYGNGVARSGQKGIWILSESGRFGRVQCI